MSVLINALPLADASNLLAAREQMAFTLGFHIVLACLGVAFPAIMLIANYRGCAQDDADAMRAGAALVEGDGGDLRRRGGDRHRPLVRVRPALAGVHEALRDVIGVAFAIEGIFFFTEAIFLAIYIYGWKRLSAKAHFWTGVPIVRHRIGGGVLDRRGQLLDEPAAGVHPGRRRQGRLTPIR